MSPLFLTLLLPGSAFAAPDADVIHRAFEAGDIEKAEKRCEKWGAADPTADPAVREACARVDWRRVEPLATPEDWASYRQTWAGTKGEQPALEREALLSLERLGSGPSEALLLGIAERYPGTPAADVARRRAALTAAAAVREAGAAVKVVRDYPDMPELAEPLMEAWPLGFAVVDIDPSTLRLRTSLKEGVQTQLPLAAYWAVRAGDGTVTPSEEFGTAQLVANGVPEEVVQSTLAKGAGAGRVLPLCADWADPALRGGVALSLGGGVAFLEQPWTGQCGPEVQPVFLTLQAGQTTSLSMRPGHSMVFPTAMAYTGFTWTGQGTGSTDLYVPFQPGEPVVVGNAQVIGQQLGALYLVHPVGGGLPWITNMSPPTTATPVTSKRTELPEGWSLTPVADSTRVDGPGAEGWMLPPGEVRVLPPLSQWMTQLSAVNPKLDGSFPPPLPSLSTPGAWNPERAGVAATPPPGTSAIPLSTPAADEADEMLRMLADAGVHFRVKTAWRLNLDEDLREEYALDLERGGVAVRAVVDVYGSGARRIFLFDARPEAQFDDAAGTPFAFRRDGQAYLAWAGMNAGVTFVEAVHLDDRGLVRELLTR
ncbi:MAG: hypothetical protein JXX28_12860 [Deltaproteobacteria bacterium]|nr:hypothetical protein [Deltaproteobacteria bacterium]